jgi:hypothetical protein
MKTGQARTLVACLDVSASVPRSLVQDSERFLAHQVRAAARVGSGRSTVYVRTISDNSVNPANNLLTIQIPAVPRAVKAKLSVFDPHKGLAQEQYDKALKRQTAALQRARARAEAGAAALQRLNPTSENRGTDLYACPAVASRLLPHGTPSWLLVVSDLIPANAPTNLKFTLPGTRAVVFQYCGANIASCQQNADRFTGRLKGAGASSTAVYDITQLATIPDPLPGF